MPHDVLVIDDDLLTCKLMSYVLASRGIASQSAVDVESARIALDETRPSVIVLDVLMPDVDGLTFAREIRACPRHRDIPIVMVSACAMVGDREAGLAAGGTAYFTKPLSYLELASVIASYVEAEP